MKGSRRSGIPLPLLGLFAVRKFKRILDFLFAGVALVPVSAFLSVFELKRMNEE